MFQNSALPRPGEPDEQRLARERMPGDAYSARSPTQTSFGHSPTSRSHPSNPPTPAPLPPQANFAHVRTSPSSPSSATLPPITSALFSRDGPPSKFYDPTQDRTEGPLGLPGPRYSGSFNTQGSETYHRGDPRPAEQYHPSQSYRSPVAATFPHHPQRSPILNHPSPQLPPPSRIDSQPQPPLSPDIYRNATQLPPPTTPSSSSRRPSSDKMAGTANVMSLSNIMSDSGPAPPVKSASPHVSHERRPSSRISASDTIQVEQEDHASPHTAPILNGSKSMTNGDTPYYPPGATIQSRGPPVVDEKEVEAQLAKIDSMCDSDVEMRGFEAEHTEYAQQREKRMLAAESEEGSKRKRRRVASSSKLHEVFGRQATAGREHYFRAHAEDAWKQVQHQEIEDEKARKKDMQRKRRREQTLKNENQRRQEAMAKAEQTGDPEEREKLMREAQRAEKKVKHTATLLQGGTPSKDIRELTPHGPNLEGGAMATFQLTDDVPRSETGKRRGGRVGGTRPRKSKEQKQAEKDAAAAAQAALERGEELPTIAPKEEARLAAMKRERSYTEESTPMEGLPLETDTFLDLNRQIWKDIARKDVMKVWRIKSASLDTKQSNARKTAQLAAKEARRWQLRTNKSTKDVQARAKRSMREMLSFWKRNEREERDQRKMAERQELEMAKKAEADREANRQKRKLNFLISQTELYSHFIGKKVKTDELERSTDDVDAVTQKIIPGDAKHTIDMPDSVAKIGSKVTNFEDLDFDAEDESALQEAAMANAQNAVKEAQDRARAFNDNESGDQQMAQFDEGEMNFQNPSSLQSMDIPQPKMLSCQLKEYQLKGLNWLVNLYEQGINGILADEMGLGKTVQSISVMAYLAEAHNIWGPFLVIAPASTLHNWQQEITRFVPNMKVLPYWGNAKDRKVLRKTWDRKHITYHKDSEFHVLVTSYQLVVQDAAYFQKIRWQYMILDEAQAIKSSQSSRWKSLLGFHCRNRLLLTGTPIQNNMQELWALLHFIMPSLFDSHDEFSDWFSKDIESHAQSNTKLNEDQLKRLHMILKPFMLRRIKKHVQKELGDKIELDVFCDLTYRQRAYYTNLRNKISIMDLIEKAALGGDTAEDSSTLMNLVMQFRKVCNHPDLFERADTASPFSFSYFAETASFMREGNNVLVKYSVRNMIEFSLPRLVYSQGGRLDLPGPHNPQAGWRGKYLNHLMNIWTPEHIDQSEKENSAFSWLRFADVSANEVASLARMDEFDRAVALRRKHRDLGRLNVVYDEDDDAGYSPAHVLFNIVERNRRQPLAEVTQEGRLHELFNVSRSAFDNEGLGLIEPSARPNVTAPPVDIYCCSQNAIAEKQNTFFNPPARRALYGLTEKAEQALVESKAPSSAFPVADMLPEPSSRKARYTYIQVPSMRRFVTDSGKLGKLDELLFKLKEGGHRVLLYFQMTRMIDLMEEYLTYRNYKYCRLDGSTKLEDRRDTVADFQTRPEIFVFLLSTRAGGLGINLTSADTVIFYDSDWNPTIDSQAMDRAHRLGQTKQVTVYRMITRGTIEERIRKRALQKEEVQRVVISGQAGGQVDFGARGRDSKTKDLAMWLADDDQAAELEAREAELAKLEEQGLGPSGKKKGKGGRKKDVSLDDMYHEGEGRFDDESNKPSGAATPIPDAPAAPGGKRKGKGMSKKAKTLKQRLAVADGQVDLGGSMD